jgi:GTP cyclohydrolase II
LPISLTIDEIESFDYFSCYDLEYNCHAKAPTEACEDVTLYAFRSAMTGSTHYAIVIKNPTSLVRIHSSCYTGDLMFSLRCDCKYQLHNAIKFISNSGGGMIIYLSQEGRGIGLASKIKTYSLQQGNGLNTIDSNLCLGFENDYRNFYPAKKILDYFKINEISLITNNPQKSKDIAGHGVTVTSTVNIPSVQNKHNQEYLKTKQNILGHS